MQANYEYFLYLKFVMLCHIGICIMPDACCHGIVMFRNFFQQSWSIKALGNCKDAYIRHLDWLCQLEVWKICWKQSDSYRGMHTYQALFFFQNCVYAVMFIFPLYICMYWLSEFLVKFALTCVFLVWLYMGIVLGNGTFVDSDVLNNH